MLTVGDDIEKFIVISFSAIRYLYVEKVFISFILYKSDKLILYSTLKLSYTIP